MPFVFTADLAGVEHNREFASVREALAYADRLRAEGADLRAYRIELAVARPGYVVIEQR